jgi:hypothetical protein
MTLSTANPSARNENGVGLAILNRFTHTSICRRRRQALAVHPVEALCAPDPDLSFRDEERP